MRYPYYNPNLNIGVLFKAFFLSSKEAERRIKKYFSNLTQKKYILITNSCRTALYLAYQSIEKNGEIITSPLTCKVAVDPIAESENIPVFADINIGDLNINTNDIEHRITANTIAIQAIHFGGVSCDMVSIHKIAKKNKLWVIEDCAQALGATFNDKNTGFFGDIACFSLIKNAYGIGGGILATDNKDVYDNALSLNQNFSSASTQLLIFRIIRNLTETYRKSFLGNIAYKVLMVVKGKRRSYSSVTEQLKKVAPWQLRICAIQIVRLPKLNKKRKSIGRLYYSKLKEYGLLYNSEYNPDNSSFTKFFLYNPQLDTRADINRLRRLGIEAMHLEHKQGNPYQKKIVFNKKMLKNYCAVHDSLVSLPISEKYDKYDIKKIINFLRNNDQKKS